MRALRDRAVEISDDVHRLAYQLHASILDDLGLSAALQAYIDEFTRCESIQVGFVRAGLTAPIPPEVASCLYRVTQEALRNVAKHANSPHASVSVEHLDAGIRLVVADSGVGYDMSVSEKDSTGLGVVGMQERVRLVHGRFSVTSRPGAGTQVEVWIPLENPKS